MLETWDLRWPQGLGGGGFSTRWCLPEGLGLWLCVWVVVGAEEEVRSDSWISLLLLEAEEPLGLLRMATYLISCYEIM